MRVVFLTWRDTTHPDGGGSEVYVEEVARELAAPGHEVTIRVRRGTPALRGASAVGGGRHAPARWAADGLPARPAVAARPRARRTTSSSTSINGLPFATPLVRRRGVVALVHHVHREQWRIIYPGLRGRLGWFVEGRLAPRLYRRVPFLTVSQASRARPRRARPRRRARSPSPATDSTPGRPTSRPSPEPAPVSCSRGSCRTSRSSTRSPSWPPCVTTSPDLHLDVVGEGWWREQLEDEARRRRLDDAVTFHGHVDGADARPAAGAPPG